MYALVCVYSICVDTYRYFPMQAFPCIYIYIHITHGKMALLTRARAHLVHACARARGHTGARLHACVRARTHASPAQARAAPPARSPPTLARCLQNCCPRRGGKQGQAHSSLNLPPPRREFARAG